MIDATLALTNAQNEGLGVQESLNLAAAGLPEALQPGIDRMAEFGDMAQRAFGQFAGAMQQSITAALLGGESLGKAMKKAAAGAVAALAAESIVRALFATAMGFAALARFDFSSAGKHFLSAALLGAIGGIAALGARALAPAGTRTATLTTPSGGPGGIITSSDQERGPISTSNIRGLQVGGLVTRPTLALLGEGGEPELVSPLSAQGGGDSGASVGGAAPLGQPIQINIEGMISQDNAIEFIALVNELVKNNDVELLSSESLQLVPRA